MKSNDVGKVVSTLGIWAAVACIFVFGLRGYGAMVWIILGMMIPLMAAMATAAVHGSDLFGSRGRRTHEDVGMEGSPTK